MEYSYLCVSSTYGGKTTYGIAIAANIDGNSVLMKTYADLSTDRERVANLADVCNRCQPDMEHLQEIIEDFLAIH